MHPVLGPILQPSLSSVSSGDYESKIRRFMDGRTAEMVSLAAISS